MGLRVLGMAPRGTGATVLHAELARSIPGYELRTYTPWLELFPPAMRWVMRGIHPHIVHASLDYGWYLRRRDTRLVVTAHGYSLDCAMRPHFSPLQYLHHRSDLRWSSRRSAEQANAIVAVSHFVARMLYDDLGVGVPVHVIYNGVDTVRFRPSVQHEKRRVFRLLFCGNLKRIKRPHLLVPLARALGSDFEIWYTPGLTGFHQNFDAGTGAARMVCTGGVPHSDMPDLYGKVDLLFMPSAREGFGLCVAEAMACGLPIVAADAGALPELVEEGAGGYLCPIDDVSAFSSAIRRIAGDQGLASRMGEFNRERATTRFNLETMVKAYAEVFEGAADCQ